MNRPQVEVLKESDRSLMVEMLEDAGDISPGIIGMYRIRRAMPDVMLVAWLDDSLVGILNASYCADFHDMRAFESFDLPQRPHAFMEPPRNPG